MHSGLLCSRYGTGYDRAIVGCGLLFRLAVLTTSVVLATVAVAASADSGVAPPRQLLAQLSKQPFESRLLPAGVTPAFACASPAQRACIIKLPGASGGVRADFDAPNLAVVVYTIFPDAATARAWFRGEGQSPQFSFWRLKQLNVVSLPHPRISGRVPGFADSVIVESSGHQKLDLTGTTSANVLSGNVIVNATTGSESSTQHGNRVMAMQLLQAAIAHLNAARKSI